MIGKRSNPVIGKLAGKQFSGGRADGSTSPRSPLDCHKIQSPRVGLAIVAALENSGDIPAGKVVYSRNSRRSVPIPVNPARNPARIVETDMGSLEEEYTTVVTCRGADNKSYTRVYYGDHGEVPPRSNRRSVFMISPARFGDFPAYPDSDFLSSCHLCHKKLIGKDIYMYRGETAFCSTECRYRQIVMDEHKDTCSAEISSSSPYTNGQMFSAGILAV